MGIKHGYLTSEALSNKAIALLDWETPTSVEGAGAPKVQAAALPTFSHKVTKAVPERLGAISVICNGQKAGDHMGGSPS
jgi:hypothetical protein